MESHSLPRLGRDLYQAHAVVHWTITLANRARGWLDDGMHKDFRELLLHASIRHHLVSPTYTLMPDHLHLIWMGLHPSSDQLNLMRFLRTQLQRLLTERGTPGKPFSLQKQSHDHVLREDQRRRGAFARACSYVLANPMRAGLVGKPELWPWSGAILPGYPNLSPFEVDFWKVFWSAYERHRVEVDPATPRSPASSAGERSTG